MKFKPEDFRPNGTTRIIGDVAFFQELSDMANARLQEMLKEAPLLYGNSNPDGHHWYRTTKLKTDTQMARLVNIEKLNSCEAAK